MVGGIVDAHPTCLTFCGKYPQYMSSGELNSIGKEEPVPDYFKGNFILMTNWAFYWPEIKTIPQRIAHDSNTLPSNGTLTPDEDTFIYRPTNGYIGPDSFSYQIRDLDSGLIREGMVRINVKDKEDNNRPVAIDDEAETLEDQPV
jgi:hypothetical protein